MKYELKKIEPLRAANLAALVYGIVMTVFALLFAPFVLFAVLVGQMGGERNPELLIMPLFLIIYPILGVVMGWLSGLITSAVYNLVVRWIGGLLVDLVEAPAGREADS